MEKTLICFRLGLLKVSKTWFVQHLCPEVPSEICMYGQHSPTKAFDLLECLSSDNSGFLPWERIFKQVCGSHHHSSYEVFNEWQINKWNQKEHGKDVLVHHSCWNTAPKVRANSKREIKWQYQMLWKYGTQCWWRYKKSLNHPSFHHLPPNSHLSSSSIYLWICGGFHIFTFQILLKIAGHHQRKLKSGKIKERKKQRRGKLWRQLESLLQN